MRGMIWAAVVAACSGAVWAEEAAVDWVKVEKGAIEAALDDRKVRYALSEQVFYASGKTLYDAGRPSWGNWREQNGQYCSEWPPNALWSCYDLYLSADGTQVRFVGASGDKTDGVFVTE